MTVLLSLIAAFLFLILSVLVYALLSVARARIEIENTVRQFITAPDEKTPSPLAQTVMAMAEVVAPAIAQSITGSLMGKASGMTRALNGAEADVANDLLAQKQPAVAALAGLFPSLQKRLARSPMLAMALSQLNIGGLLSGHAGNNGHLPGSKTSSPRFKF